MTVEELEKQMKSFKDDFEKTKKDFELKMESARKDAEQWKTIAADKDKELKEFKEKQTAREQEFQASQSAARLAENKSFLDALKKAGKITPAAEVLATKLMESMTQETVVHSYDEGGKKVTHTQLSLFKEMLKTFSKSSVFTSMTHGSQPTRETPEHEEKEENFTQVIKDGVLKTFKVDGAALDERAKSYQEEKRKNGINIDYATALIEAEKLMKQEA